MIPDHELIPYHRGRIDRLIVAFWVVSVLTGLVIGLVVALLTPLGWWGLPLVVVVELLVAAWLMSRSEGWLIESFGGVEVDPERVPRLVNVVDGLCATSGVTMPRLVIIDSEAANMGAVGRHPDRAVLVVTQGLLDTASRVELEALVANEISQIRSLDTAHVSTTMTTVGLPAFLSDIGALLRSGRGIGGGPASALGRLSGVLLLSVTPMAGLSRRWARDELEPHRDFRIDVTGVGLTRYPPGMIAALQRLDDTGTDLPAPASSSPLWVVQPTEGLERPALAARIAALEEL